MIYMGVTTFNKFLITHSCMRIRKHFGSYVYRNTETKETLFSHIFNPTANLNLFNDLSANVINYAHTVFQI